MPLPRGPDPAEPLIAPAIVAAFDGWVDAPGPSTAAAERIAGAGATLATFDADLLFDYRSRRPVLDIVDGTLTELTWPELCIRHTRTGGPELPVFPGPEPDFRWREIAQEVLEIALRL